jgi:ribosome-associated heat shock protein Hsp15
MIASALRPTNNTFMGRNTIHPVLQGTTVPGSCVSCHDPPQYRKIESMTSVRMDKWLWAARFFKTRALAARACELGRVQFNGQPVKPARQVRIGDMLQVINDGGDFQLEVLLLSEVRGPASVAQTLYRETDASRELRIKVAAERKAMKQFEQLPAGRPSKRDRRRIIQFRGRA